MALELYYYRDKYGIDRQGYREVTPPSEPEPEPVEDDYSIFTQQESTLETLQEILDRQNKQRPQPVYISPQGPQPQPENYLMYIGIGIGILLLTGKLKL